MGMPMRLRVGAATDPGRVRTMNEDVYVVCVDDGLFVVCDGMGGCPAGEVASRMAAEAILEQLNGAARGRLAHACDDNGYRAQTSRLAEAVRRSNQMIYDRAQHDPRQAGMGTTMVGAWIADHVASVAHVGDSRAYLWRGNCLELLTRDHSLVEAQVRAGGLGRDESGGSSQHNVLLRALGRTPDVDVELSEVPLRQGDYLLLCSDGLTRMVSEHEMAEAVSALRDPQTICDHLIDAANRNGGKDNITLVVVEVRGWSWRRVADRWLPEIGGARDGHARSAV
jgi:PPM family protein phosphatase